MLIITGRNTQRDLNMGSGDTFILKSDMVVVVVVTTAVVVVVVTSAVVVVVDTSAVVVVVVSPSSHSSPWQSRQESPLGS
jgi:hypothetical protein